MNRLVELPGHGMFWFLEGIDGSGPLAPAHHVDSEGRIKDAFTALFAVSYAHVTKDGTIKRFQEVIGRSSDLIDVIRARDKP